MSIDILLQKDKRVVRVGDKVVGYLEGSKFVKPVIGSKHRLRQPLAWAIDAEAFDREIRANASEFVVIDKETNTEYHVSVETFDRLKGELDRGFGRQYYLTLSHWQVADNGNRQFTLWESKGNGF